MLSINVDQKEVSKIHAFLDPRVIKGRIENYKIKSFDDVKALAKIGIGMDSALEKALKNGIATFGLDAIQGLVTTASIPVPIQFLQNWLPGLVYIQTAPRLIDDLIGMTVVGNWADEEIVTGVLERTGNTIPYNDANNVVYSNWNPNFERRTIVPFMNGIRVGIRESERASRIQVDDGGTKRSACAIELEITRNQVGFSGYNSGNNRTYGFLNDPNLPNYVNVPNGASGSPLWANKTFQEIVADIRTAFAALFTQSKGLINPETMAITLALPVASYQYLSKISDFNVNVRAWLRDNYPSTRIVCAPELNAANGGANVFYAYAEKVVDDSTDDGRVFSQNVPTKFRMLGTRQDITYYAEGYSNATAGVLLKRPYAVVRYSGI
jgi:hypothetical protein